MDNDFLEKLNTLIRKTPKVSLLNASPKAFIQYIEFMSEEQLEDILELYEFAFSNKDSRNDPFFIANYTYIRHYMTRKMIFEPIKVVDKTIYFCKN